MKKHIVSFSLIIFLVLSGCTTKEEHKKEDYLLQAVSWYQHSGEVEALYFQAYNWAKRVLDEQLQKPCEKPPAVILDIDETILDNSPQSAQQILDETPFNPENWDEWCFLAEAESLPGSLQFTKYASEQGVEIFYISNRAGYLIQPTMDNMQSLGFPDADSTHLLLKTTSSSKEVRREKVRNQFSILLLIGDNLADFSGIFDERSGDLAKREVGLQQDRFGTEFIILPNPMYGAWEKPFRGSTPQETKENLKKALISYR